MSGHRNLFPVQLLRRQRTDTGKPMTAADQHHPALSAKFKPSQISGGKTRRSKHHIQATVAQIAPQRPPVSLDHSQLNPGTLAGEPLQHRRGLTPAGPRRDAQPDRPDRPAPRSLPVALATSAAASATRARSKNSSPASVRSTPRV